MRAQVAGYIGRFITYTGTGFQEGLSLSVHDEISRMRKYAFGCSELVFQPLYTWPWRGPFTKLFRSFLLARATPLATKISVTSYINIYFAIAAAWLLGIGSYFASRCDAAACAAVFLHGVCMPAPVQYSA